MMIIIPFQHIHMQCHAGSLCPASQPMMDHLRIEIAHHRALEAEIAHEEGARGDIEHSAGEGFVKGGVGVTEAGEAGAGTERSGEGSAKSEEGVLGCMMVVDYR